jgi:hypothetical protein
MEVVEERKILPLPVIESQPSSLQPVALPTPVEHGMYTCSIGQQIVLQLDYTTPTLQHQHASWDHSLVSQDTQPK